MRVYARGCLSSSNFLPLSCCFWGGMVVLSGLLLLSTPFVLYKASRRGQLEALDPERAREDDAQTTRYSYCTVSYLLYLFPTTSTHTR